MLNEYFNWSTLKRVVTYVQATALIVVVAGV